MSKVHVCVCARLSSQPVDYPILITPLFDAIEVQDPISMHKSKFELHNVLPHDVSQAETFDLTVRPLIDYTIQGNNTAIILYGPSKSGKTYTAIGGEYPNTRGLVPRIIGTILEDVRSQNTQFEITVSLSVFELFNDQIRDLGMVVTDRMAREKYFGQNLLIEERRGVSYVKELTEINVIDIENSLQVIRQALDLRKWLELDRGSFETRAHTFYRIKISSRAKDESESMAGSNNIWVIDLARNETNTDMTGKELQESISANLHITVLGKIIKNLKKTTRLNLKESKLTHILQECFKDGGCIELFATLNPLSNINQTLNTLKYAHKCMPATRTSKLISRNSCLNGQFTMIGEKIRKLQEERMELKLELTSIETMQQDQFQQLLKMFGIPGDIDSIFQNGPHSQSMKQIARQISAMDQIKVELNRGESLENQLQDSRDMLKKYRKYIHDNEEKHILSLIQMKDTLHSSRDTLNEKKYNLNVKLTHREKQINSEFNSFISHTNQLIVNKQKIIKSIPITYKSLAVDSDKLQTFKNFGTKEAQEEYAKYTLSRSKNLKQNFDEITASFTQRIHTKDSEILKATEHRAEQKRHKK